MRVNLESVAFGIGYIDAPGVPMVLGLQDRCPILAEMLPVAAHVLQRLDFEGNLVKRRFLIRFACGYQHQFMMLISISGHEGRV